MQSNFDFSVYASKINALFFFFLLKNLMKNKGSNISKILQKCNFTNGFVFPAKKLTPKSLNC